MKSYFYVNLWKRLRTKEESMQNQNEQMNMYGMNSFSGDEGVVGKMNLNKSMDKEIILE